MQEDINKKIDEVYNKEFKSSILGYNKNLVDEYLDEIILMLEYADETIEIQKKNYDKIVKENLALKSQVIKLEKKIKELNISKNENKELIERKLRVLENQLISLKNENDSL